MKTKETKIINESWRRLSIAFDPCSYTQHSSRLLEQTVIESKAHDRFRGSDNPRDILVMTEAKYFAIKRLYSYAVGLVKVPDVKDYMHYQRSCYIAYALAFDEQTKDYVAKWLKTDADTARLIASWDYCDLMDPEKKVSHNVADITEESLRC